MDLLNVECLNATTKQANVRITTDKKCAVCSRSIGEKVIFMVIRYLLSIQMLLLLIIHVLRVIQYVHLQKKTLRNILSSELLYH